VGFGTSPYGTSAFGSLSVSTSISVVVAWAISTHGVRVTLSAEPLHEDPFAEGDALNARSWTVVDQTTGRALTVVAAKMADDFTVDLTTLEALGDDLETHLVTAVELFSLDGAEVSDPVSASFLGIVATTDRIDSQRVDLRDRDFANPPFQISRGLGYAGTLRIGSDGDFETDSGTALTRKLVLRRLNTPRGAYKHLPNYGVGFLEKEPVGSGGDLLTILRDCERQARQEPSVSDAEAHGSLDRSGVLVIQLQIAEVGGAQVTMRMAQRDGRMIEV